MLFSAILTAAAFASSALALPSLTERQTATSCLTKPEATTLVGIYQQLIANYSDALAAQYCSEDFADYSDSINTFLNQPLGGATFATKKIFMDAQELNPPFPLVVDSIDAVDCTFITLRWHATFGDAMKPSKGITVLELTKATGAWQIKLIDVEFNALTWLLDMGGSYIWEGSTYSPTGVTAGPAGA
jgi:hypothetical protein